MALRSGGNQGVKFDTSHSERKKTRSKDEKLGASEEVRVMFGSYYVQRACDYVGAVIPKKPISVLGRWDVWCAVLPDL